MPAIREYSAPENLGIRTNEGGVTATARSAAGVQRAYDEAARAQEESGRQIGSAVAGLAQVSEAVDKLEEHREVSVGAAALAKMHAEATTQWNEAAKTADPNDPAVGPKFLKEKLEPNLETFREGFTTQGGQKWAEARVAAFRDHMTQKVAADQATMAGHAIAVNLEKTRNNLSATVRSDPTSTGESLKIYESAVEKLIETSPTLTGVQASKVRTDLLQHGKSEIVKSSLIGLAAINPDAAMKAVESGKYSDYISGPEAKMIVANAKQQIRAERTDQAYARHLQEQQRKEVSEAAENEVIKDIYSGDMSARAGVSSKSIVNDDRLTNVTKEKLLRILEHEATKKEAVLQSDPATRERLAVGLFDRTAPTTLEDVIRAHAERKLSDTDFAKLRQNVMDLKKDPLAGPATQAAIHAAKDQLTYQMPGLPGKDPKGSQAYADFMNEFVARYLALPPDERPKATNFGDKSSLISEMVQKYDRTPAQKLKDRIEELSTLSPSAVTPPAPTSFTPPPTWEWNAARRQYRDPATNTIYDASGKKVKQ
jgi:hypothetical protein